ncbi:SRPBCC domain-containing protein [Saccharothrix sp. NRRL B-16348]|uniref:SRPBCC domain-containing protein n=1 Tax=Saccharothrix sp. NRRL B-16348 TaxID=1415542 RepID=UPI0006AE9915|nr:SRPBCC domain-containing protein [Saccharothrix sp. NRRL B-16348]
MIDIADQLKAVHREVQAGSDETIGVLLRRTYDAAAADVWDAVTDPDRLKRWFLPVSGDLREGGSFQVEHNAGGTVLTCSPPKLLRLTWGAETSIVELRLTEDADERTTVELEHTVPKAMAGSGAGALYVGPGWDGAFLGLGLYLAGEVPDDFDPLAAADSPETREFNVGSIDAWTAVVEASGTATDEELAAAVAAAKAQYTPDQQAEPE